MAFNGKYVSIQVVLERVFRDAYEDMPVNLGDIMSWAGEAMDKIGAPVEHMNKVTNGVGGNPNPIDIVSYKGRLPCDFDGLTAGGVRDYYSKTPMLPSTDLYFDTTANSQTYSDTTTVEVGEDTTLPTATFYVDENGFPILPNDIEYIKSLNANSGYPYTRDLGSTLYNQYTYRIQGDYIKVAFETGKVEICYTAIPMDVDGFPLIPDNTRYIQGVEWYIIERLDYKLWRAGRLADKVYQDTRQRMLFAIPSAGTAMRIPTIDQMESHKNQFLRLIPKINEHASAFRYMNIQEQMNVHRHL